MGSVRNHLNLVHPKVYVGCDLVESDVVDVRSTDMAQIVQEQQEAKRRRWEEQCDRSRRWREQQERAQLEQLRKKYPNS